ncbi:MAG: RpiB/LacA/LacB family sugar-phosphate isomerase, partial [Balneolaceae bacterium]
MIIPIASDHAGYKAKQITLELLEEMGHEPVDFGTHSDESTDYPDYAILVAKKVDQGEYPLGVLICGSGQGMCMTANKYSNIRAALVYNQQAADLSR